MTIWTWLGVAVLGGAGAVGRFALDRFIGARIAGELPCGTFAINISGALVLGLLDGLALHGDAMLLAGTAAIGSYTTFSTWMFETQRLTEGGEFTAGLANVVGSLLAGFAAVALGHLIGAHV